MDKKAHILFVDDEQDFAETIAFKFKSKGHFVKSVCNGRDAIKIVREEPFDVVFLDIHMPEMDGIEILRNIREFNKDISVILVTVVKDEKQISQAMKLGISGFIPKRSSLEELEKMLDVTLRTPKSQKPSS